MADSHLLSIAEAAQRTGTSASFWRREIRARRIRHFRLGRTVRIAEADLAQFLAARAVGDGTVASAAPSEQAVGGIQ